MNKNTDINKTKDLQKLMSKIKNRVKVKCTKCKAITHTDDLNEWKNHNEICFNCRESELIGKVVICKFCKSEDVIRQGIKKLHNANLQRYKCKSCGRKFHTGDVAEISIQEYLSNKFEILMNLREQYFSFFYGEDFKSGFIKELEDFFDVDFFEVFSECYGYDYSEYFNMGEGKRISFNELENLVKAYNSNGKKVVCSGCRSLINYSEDFVKRGCICITCFNHNLNRRNREKKKEKKESEIKRG